jgi:hypothetical protein
MYTIFDDLEQLVRRLVGRKPSQHAVAAGATAPVRVPVAAEMGK